MSRELDPDLAWRILEIARDEESENFDLHLLPGPRDLSGAANLVVIVHPGDAMDEHGIDACLEDMSTELCGRVAGGDDILVVHRYSTSYIIDAEEARHAEGEWFDKIRDLPEWTVHIYGDQLDQVTSHIAHLTKGRGYDDILVTGLWGDEEHGCAAYVSRGLGEAGLPARLSIYSPRADQRLNDEPG